MSDELTKFANVLRKEARRSTGKDPSFRVFRGWKFGVSYGHVPLPSREAVEKYKGPVAERTNMSALGEASYEQLAEADAFMKKTGIGATQWIFSACLHPRGRSSDEKDWLFLGQVVAQIGAPIDSCRTPLETTPPNDVHYWIWTEGAS